MKKEVKYYQLNRVVNGFSFGHTYTRDLGLAIALVKSEDLELEIKTVEIDISDDIIDDFLKNEVLYHQNLE